MFVLHSNFFEETFRFHFFSMKQVIKELLSGNTVYVKKVFTFETKQRNIF